MRTPLLFLLVLLCTPQVAFAQAEERTYSLDTLERTIAPTGKMRCPNLDMTRYKGATLRFHKPVYIYKDFQAPLEELESIATEVATEIYGRPPRRIVHVGTYNCRRIRRIPDLLSEHALGNAIDIEGFDFGPARSKQERASAPTKRLRRAFKVRVDKHWDERRSERVCGSLTVACDRDVSLVTGEAREGSLPGQVTDQATMNAGVASVSRGQEDERALPMSLNHELHAEFLHRFTEVLLERDVFRVYLGPAFPGHADHFHFDIAPYRLVAL